MKRLLTAVLAALVLVGPTLARTAPAGAASPDAAVIEGVGNYTSPRGQTTPNTHGFSMSALVVSGPSHLNVGGPCNFGGTSTDSLAQGNGSGTMNCFGVVASYIWVRVGVTVIIQWNPPPSPYNFAFVLVCIEVAETDPTGSVYRYQCVGAGA